MIFHKQSSLLHRFLFPTVLLFFTNLCQVQGQEDSSEASSKPISVKLTMSQNVLDMEHLKASRMGYMPTSFKVVDEKPSSIFSEPRYKGQVKYGAFRVGNGPRGTTYFAVDEPVGEAGKLYVDLNQNGDLTDDGPGDWDQTRSVDGTNAYITVVPVHASWGTALEETEGGTYSLYVYKRHGASGGGYAKISAREGELEIGKKTYHAVLVENTNDGIFTVPARGDLTRQFVQLCIDLDGDGTFKDVSTTVDGKETTSAETFNITDPVEIDGQWYNVRPTVSGNELTLTLTKPPGSEVTSAEKPATEKSQLTIGEPAPDFSAQSPEGKPIHLSDFRGKVLVIDFWATSCEPCLRAMPGLERVYQAVKDQGVEVLSLNVLDSKEVFDKWISLNRGKKYNFTFAFLQPGNKSSSGASSSNNQVPILPTIQVVSRDGKLVGILAGGGNEEALLDLLEKEGIKIKER